MLDDDGSFIAKAFALQDGDTKLYLTLTTENVIENGQEDLTIPYLDDKENNTISCAQQVSTTIRVRFFAEGAANVLFTILPTEPDKAQSSPANLLVNNYLLRLRKADRVEEFTESEDTPKPPPYVSAAKICHFIDTEIKPIIPSQFLIDHLRVAYSENFLDRCNSVLRFMEVNETRKKKRRKGYLDDGITRVGLLVENMKPNQTDDAVLIEFKFKWLKQSPGAPSNSRRCRTCAWHIMTGLDTEKRYCPLALASGNEEVIMKQIRRLFKISNIKLPSSWRDNEAVKAITAYFQHPLGGSELLNALKISQEKLDPDGILNWVPVPKDVGLASEATQFYPTAKELISEHLGPLLKLARAMTLRDCTVFVKVIRDTESELSVSAKLGDLDPKLVREDKVIKWAKDELGLIGNGFYEGKDLITPVIYPEAEYTEVCMLWQRQ
jgi:inositol-pentakisphosphate 2-kinase